MEFFLEISFKKIRNQFSQLFFADQTKITNHEQTPTLRHWLFPQSQVRNQISENRKLKIRKQKSQNRKHKTEIRKQKSRREITKQKSQNRNHKTEITTATVPSTDRPSWNRQLKINPTNPRTPTSSRHQPTQVNQDSQIKGDSQPAGLRSPFMFSSPKPFLL